MSEIKLTPFRFWCQKVIPLVYDDSLSYYELLCKVVDHINSLIQNDTELNEQINQLYTIMQQILSGEYVREEVERQLDQMVEDGTLEEMLADVIHSKMIMLNKYGRLLYDGTKDETYAIGGQAVVYDEMKYYEGGNIADNHRVINVFNSVGVLLQQELIDSVTHINDIGVVDDTIYIVTAQDANVFTIDKETLAVTDTIDLSDYFSRCNGCSGEDGSLWVYGADPTNVKYNLVRYRDGAAELYGSFPALNTEVVQGCCAKYPFLYVVTNMRNAIYRISLLTQEIDFCYILPDGDGLYPAGEYESAFVKDGNICVQSCLYYPSLEIGTANQAVNILFETDILKTISFKQPFSYMEHITPLTVNLYPDMQYTFNPELTVSTALEAAAILNYVKSGTIVVRGATEGSTLKFIGCNVLLKPYDTAEEITNLIAVNATVRTNTIHVNNLFANNGDCRITGIGTAGKTYTIDVRNSDLYMEEINLSNCTAFHAGSSNIKISGCFGIASDCDFTAHDYKNHLEMDCRYRTGVMNIGKICSWVRNMITGTDGTNLMMMYTGGTLNDDFTFNVADQSDIYKTVSVDQPDGTVTLVKTDDSTVALTTIGFPNFHMTGFTE